MNISGFIRSYMANNLSSEEFLKHVAGLIENQLKEWDTHYEIFVMKLSTYEIMVKNKTVYYHVQLSEDDIETLQNEEPFELDRMIWRELEKQGLLIIKGKGNYLQMVLQI
jgi:hypothetical protein